MAERKRRFLNRRTRRSRSEENHRRPSVGCLSGVRRPLPQHVAQVGQLPTCENSIKIGTWPTLPSQPTLFEDLVGLRRLVRTLRNQKTGRVEPRPPDDMMRTGEVGQLPTCEKPIKIGTWPTLPSQSTFFEDLVGLRRLVRTLRLLREFDGTSSLRIR